MTRKIRVELELDELKSLITLTELELFRNKFIDPSMPGHESKPEEIECSQSAVSALKGALSKITGFKQPITSSSNA